MFAATALAPQFTNACKHPTLFFCSSPQVRVGFCFDRNENCKGPGTRNAAIPEAGGLGIGSHISACRSLGKLEGSSLNPEVFFREQN